MTFENAARRRPPAVPLPPVSAVITAVNPNGVFATPEGQPDAHPVGPCRGPRTIGDRQIAPGMHVLLIFADSTPWIAAIDT